MQRAPIDDLLHRVNNLLSVIATQKEVAQVLGTVDAYREALRIIGESAERTHREVQQFRTGGDGVTSSVRPDC